METTLAMHSMIPVTETSQIGQVRRAIQEMATRTGLSEDAAGRALLVATELTTNLVKHAGGGEILFCTIHDDAGEASGIEIVSMDKGRGIGNIGRAFHDGFSTAGSPGTGLGAIQRMSDALEIFSAEDFGTVISAQIRPRVTSRKFAAARIRSIFLPLNGYAISGDFSVVVRKGTIVHILLADGLGHGEEAAVASRKAGETFRAHIDWDFPELMKAIHDSLVKTRGAALALARFDTRARTLQYMGVGNIESRICSLETSQGCATLNGTAGLMLPRLVQFSYPVPAGAVLIMHTDGLSTRWNLRDYPGLNFQSPGAIAGVLFRDFARKRDDASILVFAT
jgi:anti-sigma regulatory factor (Ser/Thr protein kinase)